MYCILYEFNLFDTHITLFYIFHVILYFVFTSLKILNLKMSMSDVCSNIFKLDYFAYFMYDLGIN